MTRILKPAKSPPATIVAMQKIKQLIFSGELAADSNHLETELAELLGMSRTPVREATLMIQAQGLLEVKPRKGIRIKAISISDINNFYDVLTELECLAIARAASAELSMNMISEAQTLIDTIGCALAREDRHAWIAADEEFHCELVKLSGNEQLVTITRNIHEQMRRLRMVTLHMRPLPEQSQEDHKAILNAILGGDATLAGKIARDHRNAARTMLIEILQNAGFKRL